MRTRLIPRWWVLIVALAPAGLPPAACAQTVSGVGTRDCAAFTFALQKDSEDAIDSYVAWSQGFISAFNWSNARQRNVAVDPHAVIAWLGDYCARNPEATVYNAVQELIRLNAR